MPHDYIIPKDFEDYIYVSQLLQADGMKTAMEAHRRAKPSCMGTLYWQFNDCWPVTSWSSLDYYGNWKAFQYQVKRSYENMLLSINEEDVFYKVFIVNDTLEKYSDKIILELISFDGKSLWHSSKEIHVEDNSSSVVFEISKAVFSKFDLQQAALNVQFRDATSHYFFGKPKELKLVKPNIQIKKIDELTYELASDVLAKNVYLSSEQETFFSDNYFDVLPNQKVQIKLSKPVQKITIKSLFDTLN